MKTFLLTLLCSSILAAAADTTRVLWLGNSLIRSTFSRINEVAWASAERGVPVKQVYGGYQYDAEYGWNKVDTNKTIIRNGGWDYVVVQVFGTSGCVLQTYAHNPIDSMLNVMRKWDALIDSCGAKTVFYMPWGTSNYVPIRDSLTHSWKPDRMDTATALLRGMAAELGAGLFPVGTAQFEVQKRDPSVRLFEDWIHGSAAAGYLGGLISFSVLTGQDPRGLRNFYPAYLDSITAFFLQQLAWQTVYNSAEIPFRGLWIAPALVNRVTLRAPGLSGDTLEQYLGADLVCDLVKSDASSVTGTNKALFLSLTPDLATVNHYGHVQAKMPGRVLIEALAGDGRDTLALTVTPSTARFDSVRIAPRLPSTYVSDGYQFTAAGFAFQKGQAIQVDFTDLVQWESGDTSLFKIIAGKVRKVAARGGSQWAAIHKGGLSDTVRFSMIQDLTFLTRINFQTKDTVYNPYWKGDWGRPYTDSVGYGWVNSPVVATYAEADDIKYDDSLFLTSTCVTASASSTVPEGTYKIKCHDADYIIRVALGHPYYNRNCYIRHGADTLFKWNGVQGKLIGIHTDTITVREEAGIILTVSGPIAYLVAATSEGVNIDSIAYDTRKTMPGGMDEEIALPLKPFQGLSILPNPFSSRAVLRMAGAVREKARIYAINGRLVAELSPSLTGKTMTEYAWNTSGVPAGIYYAEVRGNGVQNRIKMVLAR